MITPKDHIKENEEYEKNFYIDSKSLFCTFCKCIVNHKNKFLLDQHFKTDKYRTNEYKTKNLQKTSKMVSNINTCQEKNETINIDLIYTLTQANILLEKVDKLKLKYLSIIFDSEIEDLKKLLVGQKISITVDESSDVCGRAAVNILFSFCNKTKLVKTEHLTVVNNITIAQFVLKTLQFYNISLENILLFISDNAFYMIK
ncbi:2618_t:CDS:2, partial [Scutellospora calospora]